VNNQEIAVKLDQAAQNANAIEQISLDTIALMKKLLTKFND
jgi:hypothetical protein